MSSQFSDQMCDLVYKSSEKEKILFLETSYACINEKSENFLSNSFEVVSFSDGAISCENYCYSECDENPVVTSQIIKEIQSTREKLTFDWVKAMSRDVLKFESDSSFECSNNSSNDNLKTDSETDYSFEIDPNNSIETSPEGRTDAEIVDRLEDSKDSDLSELTFCFADAVTEENYDSGFSFSTKGSLANFTDDDFLEDDDGFELVFSNSPLAGVNLPGWADIMSEASELSQSFDNEIFVDFFESPAKSRVKRINERWEKDMCDVNDKPRDPVKVTFAPLPDLVTVHCFQKPLEEVQPSYDTSALDRIRFQNRIEELSRLLTPILTLEHRTNIILRNSLFITHD